ncbi:hypothetical protein [Sulfurimonas autotrophica]|uniref:Uncharacterized protein n=1 Tax=Sulfurimonas autotrophica (strain ATCC BAA-671 / DSM 16294 / JCM 11897 / OK10) TaxID=563040 RepID=E0URN0_SULAO|nr:hypothetical protein [Sulfurimonas autotrophica]ADN08974.1 conserved hypothetical protein [Sulfurimonas autotrophica DSM 16294]
MKLLLVIILFIGTILSADDLQVESAIYNKIISAVTKKEKPKVYIYKHCKSLEKYPGNIKLVSNCKDADIVIVTTLKDIPKVCYGKNMFGTKYSHLKNPNVLGAFFWQKGRPNILFYKYRLDQNHIKLDKSFNKYIEQ